MKLLKYKVTNKLLIYLKLKNYLLLQFFNFCFNYNQLLLITIDFLHNVVNKEEFERNTKHRTTAYTLVREDSSIGLTYKLPLETSYARSLIKNNFLWKI
ncbi:RPE1 domain protein [Rickettsia endosymbiont of Ixodes pacificus]|nr:RPE1 domain protein [Rickettsia endosymbiont of Ixodes pacificus]